MSSAALAVILSAAAGPVSGPMADGSVVGSAPASADCANADAQAIVVCGRQLGPSPRLPMPEDRFAAGEVVRHPSDGPRQDPGPPGDPGHLMQTLGKAIAGVRSLLTGEDPGF